MAVPEAGQRRGLRGRSVGDPSPRAASRRLPRTLGLRPRRPDAAARRAAAIVDAGDVPGEPDDGPGNSAATTAAVTAILERGAVPVCIGGDDSVPIPILRAYAGRGPITVVQVDAHLDFRDEVHGVREGYSSPMRRASEMDHVTRIVQVGLRGVGSARPSDVEDARAAGNLLVTAREVRQRGVGWVLDQLPADASVFLSFDCDGLDPAVVPGGLRVMRPAASASGGGRAPGRDRPAARRAPRSPSTCPRSTSPESLRWWRFGCWSA